MAASPESPQPSPIAPPSPSNGATSSGGGAPRQLRAAFLVTATLCMLAMGTLAALSSSRSSPITWRATTELQQSMQFLQQSLDPIQSSSHASSSMGDADTLTTSPPPSEETVSSSSLPNESGIVLCLHDGIASMGASLIRELRCLGNTERIQVFYCFDDELSPESRAILTRNDANVEIIDVCSAYLNDPNVFHGDRQTAMKFRNYWIKPLALHYTKLRHVVLLDADAILLQDPARLRESSTGYNRTGTIFFHDRIHKMRKFFNTDAKSGEQTLRFILRTFDYARFGLPPHKPSKQLLETYAYKRESAHEMDSSMVFIDKNRAGKAMDVLLHLILDVRMKTSFSWGDKESFWLAYEIAQRDYFFSPWGLSLLDSVPAGDLKKHPKTLCGSMAHFVPTEDGNSVPELLYVNGKALIDPIPVDIKKIGSVAASRLYNVNPTHVTPRYNYSTFDLSSRKSFECADNLGATPLPADFHEKLLRRRHHFLAAEMRVLQALDHCDV